MTNKDILSAFPVNLTNEDIDTIATLHMSGEDIPDTLLIDLQQTIDQKEVDNDQC